MKQQTMFISFTGSAHKTEIECLKHEAIEIVQLWFDRNLPYDEDNTQPGNVFLQRAEARPEIKPALEFLWRPFPEASSVEITILGETFNELWTAMNPSPSPTKKTGRR